MLLSLLIIWELSTLSDAKVVERSGWSKSSYTFVDINYKWTVGSISFLFHRVSSETFSATRTTMDAVKWKLLIVDEPYDPITISLYADDIGEFDEIRASYTFNVTDITSKNLFSAKSAHSAVFNKAYPERKVYFGELTELITKQKLPSDTIIVTAFIRMGESISVLSSENPSRYIDVPVCDNSEEANAAAQSDIEYSKTYFVLDAGETAPVPRSLLASKSVEFDHVFKTSIKPIPEPTKIALPDMDLKTLQIILSFAYSGENLTSQIPPGSGLEKKLLAASHKYGLKNLKLGVQNVLGHQVTKENALDMLDLAEEYDAGELKNFIVDFIRKNALNMSREEWKLLVDQMTMKQCEIISNTTCH